MKRKVIKQGSSSLTISLPSFWTKKFNVKAGDELFIIEQDKSLNLSSKSIVTNIKSKINISGLRRTLAWVYLNNLYIRGDDEIEIQFANAKEFELIQSISTELIGFSIIEQHKNTCIVKDLSGITEDSFDTVLRRVFSLILMMGQEGLEILQSNDIKKINEIASRDQQINRLISYSLRSLNKKGYNDFKKTNLYTTILYLLEHLGDEYSRIYRDIKKPVSKEVLSIFSRVIKHNKNFNKIFYDFNQILASDMIDERNNLRNDIDAIISKKSISDASVLYRLKKIAELIVDILKIEISMYA